MTVDCPAVLAWREKKDDTMTDISKEAVERLAAEMDERVAAFDLIAMSTPESVRALKLQRGEKAREQHDLTAATLRAQAARIAELEAALKKVLRICENRQPDKISDGAHIARQALAKDTSHDG